MIYSDELLAVAKRIFCFWHSGRSAGIPNTLLTYAMTYASDEDIEILKKHFSDDEFKAAMDDIPPLPKRRIPGVDPATVPDFFPAKP